jgi:hypothetical protein
MVLPSSRVSCKISLAVLLSFAAMTLKAYTVLRLETRNALHHSGELTNFISFSSRCLNASARNSRQARKLAWKCNAFSIPVDVWVILLLETTLPFTSTVRSDADSRFTDISRSWLILTKVLEATANVSEQWMTCLKTSCIFSYLLIKFVLSVSSPIGNLVRFCRVLVVTVS